ncbi:MAG: 4Fe-4S binding protein [Phycisphaerae bacterium]|nr:4Fe-4S binding protein [Phycisphaerae bacterium]
MDGFNLLRLRPVRVLVHWGGFPYVFQALFLVVFVALGVFGWGRFTPDGVNDKLYAKCNIVTLLIWAVWWPAMIWLAVLLGRAWCTVCPLELVGNISERIGRRLSLPQASLPRWVAAGALIVALYALVQLVVAGLHIHRVPHYTALFLGALLGLSLVTGLLLKDRAFCRGFCPVGLLLGTYGRGGMLAVRPHTAEACRECAPRDCLLPANRTKLDARSCPSLLTPSRLDSNRDCLICCQCIKACQLKPKNMQLLLRRPFHPDDAREGLASWPVTLFVLLVSGFVAYELCSEWKPAKVLFGIVPHWLTARIGSDALAGWINGIWMLVVVPLVGWTVLGLLTRLLGGATSVREAWRRLALPLVVIIAAGHMAKGLAKFTSWGAFLPHALNDSSGVTTATAFGAGAATLPPALLGKGIVSPVGVILVAAGFLVSLREAKRAGPERPMLPVVVPLVAVGLVLATLVLGWGM